MKDIAIYGAGGFGREVALIDKTNKSYRKSMEFCWFLMMILGINQKEVQMNMDLYWVVLMI